MKHQYFPPFFLQQTSEEWKAVFFISAGIYITGCLCFSLLSSGELQPWAIATPVEINVPNPSKDENTNFISQNGLTDIPGENHSLMQDITCEKAKNQNTKESDLQTNGSPYMIFFKGTDLKSIT